MKPHILILLFCTLLYTSCSKNDENSHNEDSPVTSYGYIEFLKSDGTHFQEGEIEFRDAMVNSEGDTIYSNWKPLQVFGETHNQFPSAELLFGPLVVAGYDNLELEQGDSWDTNMMYWFKYAESEQIDFLKINDRGEYQEFREIKFYLNDESLEPDQQNGSIEFFFQLTKNEF